MFEVCRTQPFLEQHETAIVDSGCTGHFLLETAPCLNKVKSRNPLTVRLPNGATMEYSHTDDYIFSLECHITLYFRLASCATKAT
jgi:hypothetical protein